MTTSKLANAVDSIIQKKEFIHYIEELYDILDSYYDKQKIWKTKIVECSVDTDWDSMILNVFNQSYSTIDECSEKLRVVSSFLSVKTTKEQNMSTLNNYEEILTLIKMLRTSIFKQPNVISEISSERSRIIRQNFIPIDAETDFLSFIKLLNKLDVDEKTTLETTIRNRNEHVKSRFQESVHISDKTLMRWYLDQSIHETERCFDILKKIYVSWKKLTNKDFCSESSTMY